MSDLTPIFIAGAAIHAAALLGFGATMLALEPGLRRTFATSAALVAATTAAVYVAQTDDAVRVTSIAAEPRYVAEWLGYAISLVAIGRSLARFVGASSADVASAAYALALVGAGGVLGLFVTDTVAQVLVFAATSVVYVVFFAIIVPGAVRTGRVGYVVYFAATTLVFYVLAYALGPPAANVISSGAEHVLYLVGNVFTKIILPIMEITQTQKLRIQ